MGMDEIAEKIEVLKNAVTENENLANGIGKIEKKKHKKFPIRFFAACIVIIFW